MSHTNSTTNYNLPQFVGSDKPAWLGDINPAMSTIDTQMKATADATTTAGSNATTALNGIGTLANLTTTEKSNLVGAVNEIDTELGVVSGVASGASSSASQANNAITTLTNYLDFVSFKEKTPSVSGGTLNFSHVYCASNADGSLGKIYGFLSATCTNSNGGTITIPSELRPSETITVYGIAIKQRVAPEKDQIYATQITIAPNGNVTIPMLSGEYNSTYYYNLMACVIFCKNFGDTPYNA